MAREFETVPLIVEVEIPANDESRAELKEVAASASSDETRERLIRVYGSCPVGDGRHYQSPGVLAAAVAETVTGEQLFDDFAACFLTHAGQAVDEWEDIHPKAQASWDALAEGLLKKGGS